MLSKFSKHIVTIGSGLVLSIGFVSAGDLPLPYGIEDKEEAFLVRRIAEFWKDQDYQIVKTQITDFLEKYPKSKINDHLRGILGDLFLQENSYEKALSIYQEIRSPDILRKIALNKLQCLYELAEYEKMITEGKPFLSRDVEEIQVRIDEFNFLMGEAYFRTALTQKDEAKKIDLLQKAEPFYEKVLNSSFNDPTMFALAEIHRQRKHNEKAAAFFIELAERHMEQSDDLLFHAGLAQAEFNKNEAIGTFTKIIEKKGAKSKDAALNRLILYFQNDQFNDVINSYPSVANETSQEKQSALDYIMGRSYFATGKYDMAADWLEKYAKISNHESPELRNTLLMQLSCRERLGQESKYKEVINDLQKYFPHDSELAQATFIHAMMLKEISDFAGAEKKLESIVENHPNYEDKESLYLEYGIAAYNNKNYSKSHDALVFFLAKFPKSPEAPLAWKYFLSASLNLLKEMENGALNGYTKLNFYNDLTKVLAMDSVLSSEELRECLFLRGKIAYELGNYKEAISFLSNYQTKYQNDPANAEINLMIALCYNKLGVDKEKFCEHAEAALKENPNLKNRSSVHLELYNAYVTLLNSPNKNEGDLYSIAAEHLYQAMTLGEIPIRLENKLWLANYYYNLACDKPQIFQTDGSLPTAENESLYKRSYSILENLLLENTTGQLVAIDQNHLFLEWEVLKLANCFGRKNNIDMKIRLLCNLIEQQNTHPSFAWKLQKEALIELAKAYELNGNLDFALETFQFVSEYYGKQPSFATEYATIHSERLKFELMKPKQKNENNQEVFKILNTLKGFQIRKNVASEPLHLEAALEYALIRSQIANEEERATKYLFFLNRIKEDFENLEDPMIVSYQKGLKADNAKAKLYAAHMTFVDLEISRTEAIIAGKENRVIQNLELNEQIKLELTNLAEQNTSYYLAERIQKSLKALKNLKTS